MLMENESHSSDQAPPTGQSQTAPAPVSATTTSPSSEHIIVILSAVVVILTLGLILGWWYMSQTVKTSTLTANSSLHSSSKSVDTSQKIEGLQLDTSKNYGNKYAGGLLPVGDNKYVTTGPKQGYVYACGQYAQNLAADSGGASSRGPWFTNNNTQYDINKKLHVQGSVIWQADFSNTISGDTRTIVSNDLPSHPTGIFPIASTDPAYQYDRNPNTIKGQAYTFALAANPTYSSTPNCIVGQVGIMLTGVELFSAFDAGGRDAGAWEIQDSCNGHPEKTGAYHYHTLSSCIKNISIQTVIGFALDGFPITGPQISSNNILTTSDLDVCHGIISQIMLDGRLVTSYHYVMTEDFPYSVSCYRATAIQPPGLSGSQQQPPGAR